MPEEQLSLDGNRLAMAQEQKELIEALLCGAPDPVGFDSERLQLAGNALVRKRIRCMQRAHSLVQEICPRDNNSILEVLHQFIRENPSVHPQGPYFDALAFLSYLGLKSASELGWKPTRKAIWLAAWRAGWTAIGRTKPRKVDAIDQTIN
ncbi:hypothetical protein KBI23_26495 [bacterium]|nr:hypothetical protein [bacterium]